LSTSIDSRPSLGKNGNGPRAEICETTLESHYSSEFRK
jgi:hypothetical protein